MSKLTPGMSRTTALRSRCLILLPILTLFVIALSSPVQAQFHGVSMAKQCAPTTRICDTGADCSDGDLCTPDICDDTAPNLTECFIRAKNDDEFFDTLQINEAWDIIHAAGGDIRVPLVGNLPISGISGNTTCVIGAFAVCTIGPDIGGGVGEVIFQSAGYSPVPADLGLLNSELLDDGTIIVEDLSNVAIGGCNTNPQEQNFGAATDLVDGCSNGPPTDCDDSDLCTDDS